MPAKKVFRTLQGFFLFLELVHHLHSLFVCSLLFLLGMKVCATSQLGSFGTPRNVFHASDENQRNVLSKLRLIEERILLQKQFHALLHFNNFVLSYLK